MATSSRYAMAMSQIRLRCRSMTFGGTRSVVRVASYHPGQVSTLFTSEKASSRPTGANWMASAFSRFTSPTHPCRYPGGPIAGTTNPSIFPANSTS